MTWNHRVIYHPAKSEWGEPWFGIHECFYKNPDDEMPFTWTVDAMEVVGDSIEDLSKTLTRMMVALSKPILQEDGENIKLWKQE